MSIYKPSEQNKTAVEIIIPNGVKEIPAKALEGCLFATKITIPDTVIKIGASAFADCSSLTEMVLPSGLTVIEPNLFNGCKRLKSVVIPAGVRQIKYGAFAGCEGLEYLTILSKDIRVNPYAFGASPNEKPLNFCGTMQEFKSVKCNYRIYRKTIRCTDGEINR